MVLVPGCWAPRILRASTGKIFWQTRPNCAVLPLNYPESCTGRYHLFEPILVKSPFVGSRILFSNSFGSSECSERSSFMLAVYLSLLILDTCILDCFMSLCSVFILAVLSYLFTDILFFLQTEGLLFGLLSFIMKNFLRVFTTFV